MLFVGCFVVLFVYMMKVVIGADHAGFDLKEAIKKVDFREMCNANIEFIDIGAYSGISSDFPAIAKRMVKLLKRFIPWMRCSRQKHFGILICATGFGMSMVANRYRRIRAVNCHDEKEAIIARERNNANVLCLGAKSIDLNTAIRVISAFVSTKYFSNKRYNRRIRSF